MAFPTPFQLWSKIMGKGMYNVKVVVRSANATASGVAVYTWSGVRVTVAVQAAVCVTVTMGVDEGYA